MAALLVARLVACLFWAGTVSASIPPASQAGQADFTQARAKATVFDVLMQPRNVGLDAVVATPIGDFQRFDDQTTYAFDAKQVMWLRFGVVTQQAIEGNDWLFELPRPYVDRVTFYFQDPQGQWQSQEAGDRVAHANWPVNSPHPQFNLPAMASGTHLFYVAIQSSVPLNFKPGLLSARQAQNERDVLLLTHGLMAGVLLLMVVLSSVLAVSHRRWVYGQYGVFVLACFVAVLAHTGAGAMFVWPHASVWPEHSVLVGIMVAMMAQLWFCQALFAHPRDPAWRRVVFWAVMAASVAMVVTSMTWTNPHGRLAIFVAQVVLGLLMLSALVVAGWQTKPMLAKLWALAYLPLIATCMAVFVETFGLMPVSHWVIGAPPFAVVFEACVLLVAMQIDAKNLHTRDVRRATLATTDPLTGCIDGRQLNATGADLWERATRNDQDLTVAIIQRTTTLPSARNAHDAERLRTVRMIRTVLRPDDTVVQVDDARFVVFLLGQTLNHEVSARLSRLVALGRMHERNQQQHQRREIKFRIVVGAKSQSGLTWRGLYDALRALSKDSGGPDQRPIRFLFAKDRPNE